MIIAYDHRKWTSLGISGLLCTDLAMKTFPVITLDQEVNLIWVHRYSTNSDIAQPD